MDITDVSGQGEAAQEIVEPATGRQPRPHPLFRRRRYIVNWGYQLRLSLTVAALVLVLLVLLNVCIFVLGSAVIEGGFADTSAYSAQARSRLQFTFGAMISGSLFFLLTVFVITIRRSHKTAGPAFNLSRCLKRVQAGEYNTVAHLRKDDNLHDIADAFNEMVEALQERTRDDVRALRRLAHGSGKMTSDPVAQAVAEELSSLIDRKEQSLGIRNDGDRPAT